MELPAGAAAGGFTALTLEEIKRSWGQRPLGVMVRTRRARARVLAPEPLPENGDIRRHLYSLICNEYRLQAQNTDLCKNRRKSP